jgi:hypothetical protein
LEEFKGKKGSHGGRFFFLNRRGDEMDKDPRQKKNDEHY